MRVPLFDLAAQERAVAAETMAAVQRVAGEARFILGPTVESFERWLAGACGTAHAVGVASGTDAIELTLRALGVGEGDAVVTPAFSFVAAAEAIACTGARPVFCDVEADTMNASARTVRDAMGRARAAGLRVAACVPVHLFGAVADVGELEGCPSWRMRRRPSARATGRAARRLARARGGLQLLPHEEPGRVGRRRCRRDLRRRAGCARAPVARPRRLGAVRARGAREEQPARCPAGGGAAGEVGACGSVAIGARTRSPPGTSSAWPRCRSRCLRLRRLPPRRRGTRSSCAVGHPARATRSPPGSASATSRRACTTPCRCTGSRVSPRSGAGPAGLRGGVPHGAGASHSNR